MNEKVQTPNSIKYSLRLFLTGFAMGTADLIPGVSGGTIAFLSGIYEQLLSSIKTVTGETIRLLLKGKVAASVKSVPYRFLIPLALGLGSALFSLASLLRWLLAYHPVYVWSFFFGLVLASTVIVLKRVKRWDFSDIAAFSITAFGSYILMGAIPIETPFTIPYIFFSGMIAICAMILPGISGSFILLLLGKYNQILAAVTQRDVVTLGIFMAGCIIGIALFSRILTWLFATHHDISIAVLSGFMLGSIRKLWPWKEEVITRINSHGDLVPVVERNILPPVIDGMVLAAFILCMAAAAMVFYLERMKLVQETESKV